MEPTSPKLPALRSTGQAKDRPSDTDEMPIYPEEEAKAGWSMGLRGFWALVGNSTALVVVNIVMFMALFEVKSVHRDGMATLDKMMEQSHRFYERSQSELNRTLERNTIALEGLTSELRSLRKGN